ncbi:MAG TPA: hypothetical protein VN495_03360 [Candidatus Paceibacterota bacterium]|nr:hypothetical protein [Candidatus Paceibacterota bacterium]
MPEPVERIDRWQGLSGQLEKKLDWARSVDVARVAKETGSSQERVEQVAGFPSLWLAFGDAIRSEEKPLLPELLLLGRKIYDDVGTSSELWRWYGAYLSSPSGWGDISPLDYCYFRWPELQILNAAIGGIGRNIEMHLNAFASLGEYVHCVGPICRTLWDCLDRRQMNLCNAWKDRWLADGLARCHTLKDRIAFFNTIPSCPPDQPYWLCTCDVRWDVGFEVYTAVERMMNSARTVEDIEAIKVPPNLNFHRSRQLTDELRELKKGRLTEFRVREEEDRIRAAFGR